MSQIEIKDLYKKQGINLVPIPKGSGKSLNIPGGWKKYQSEMYTGEIPDDQDFAVILGKISGNLIVLDFDQCDDIQELNNIKKDILNSTLVVRTGDGYHAYFTVDSLPNQSNTFLKKGKYKMEVKGNGAYVVGASSKHYDKDEAGAYVLTGKTYNVISNRTEIARLHATGENIISKLKELGWTNQSGVELEGQYISVPTSELEKGNWESGERYNNGFKLALRKFHMGLPYDDILNEALTINQTCKPPHQTSEVERWVNDAHTQYEKNLKDPHQKYFGEKKDDKQEEEDELDKAADTLLAKYNYRTTIGDEELLIYEEPVYVSNKAESLVKEECERMIDKCSTHHRNEVINKIKARTLVNRDDFDSNPNLLTLENCILDMSDMSKKEHSPNNLTFVKIPQAYSPDLIKLERDYAANDLVEILKGTKFLEFLESCFTIEHDFDGAQFYTVMEIMACCFLKTAKFQKAFMFIGAGDNGKSVLIDYLKNMIGKENVSSNSIHQLAEDQFAPVDLYGKMANVYADIESTEMKKTGILKAIIAGDSIRGNQKYREAFSFTPYAKMIFSANHFPVVFDTSDGWFRRFIIVEWNRIFTKEEKDKDLLEKLVSNQDEKTLVFNLLIKMANNLNKRGHFKFEQNVKLVRKKWGEHSDPIQMFDKALVKTKEGGYDTKIHTYKVYREFCITKNVEPLTINRFGQAFREYYDDGQEKIEGRNRKVWIDVEVQEVHKQAELEVG